MRRKVVLYNPRCAFHTMPLALVALARVSAPPRYDVRIVDGRFEADPARTVAALAQDALCLGITVLTGMPILDAIEVTRAALRAVRAAGGLGRVASVPLPEQTLAEAGIDALVVGQGEDAFAEVVERLADGGSLVDIGGVDAAGAEPGPPAAATSTTFRRTIMA